MTGAGGPTGDGPDFIEAAYSERFVRFFGWWTRDKMLAKKFFAVRLERGSSAHLEALAGHAGPVIAATNHVSWWDPLIMLGIHRLFWEQRTLRAPMDAAQLRRFRLFRKLGTFGLDPDDPASLEAMAAYVGGYFAGEPRPTLWINPQGRFADVREPVEVRPGAARLAASDARTKVVAVSMEYQFWLDQRPEVLLRVEPVEPRRSEDGTATTAGWLRALRAAMTTNAERLAESAISRDPGRFECLVGGDATRINPVYDLWLRLRGKSGSIDDRRDRRLAGGASGDAGTSKAPA